MTVKIFLIMQIFQINAVLSNFFIDQTIQFPQKILSSSTVFNIDNDNKYFLSTE